MLSNPQVGQIVWVVENARQLWFKPEYKNDLIYRGVIAKLKNDTLSTIDEELILHKSNIDPNSLSKVDVGDVMLSKIARLLSETVTKVDRITVYNIRMRLTSNFYPNTNFLFETKEEAEQYLKEQLELLKQNVG